MATCRLNGVVEEKREMTELKNKCDLKTRADVLKDLRDQGLLLDAHMSGLLGVAGANSTKK